MFNKDEKNLDWLSDYFNNLDAEEANVPELCQWGYVMSSNPKDFGPEDFGMPSAQQVNSMFVQLNLRCNP